MRFLSRCVPLVALALLVASCDPIDPFDRKPPSDELAWVAKDYSGGLQCTADDYEPPNVESVLEEKGIAVYETEIHHRPVCAACGCPDYAATHYAQIKRAQSGEAEQLGFRQEQPPEE